MPQFTSTQEATDWAKQHLFHDANLNEMPLSAANKLVRVFHGLDKTRDLLKELSIGTHDEIAALVEEAPEENQFMTTWAVHGTSNDGAFALSYNVAMFASEQAVEDNLAANRKNGVYRIADLDGIFIHEYGHVLNYNDPHGGQALNDFRTETLDSLRKGRVTPDDIRGDFGSGILNDRGELNFEEMFAESYRMLQQNSLPPKFAFVQRIFRRHGLA